MTYKELREATGMTVAEAAEFLGINRATQHRHETSDSPPIIYRKVLQWKLDGILPE